MISTLHPLALNVVRYPEVVDRSFLDQLVGGFACGAYPADYDNVMDLSRTRRVDVSANALLSIAMARRSTLPELPGRTVRSAALHPTAEVWDWAETWNAFFGEPDQSAVVIERFNTLEAALAWIGKPEALDAVRQVLNAPR